MYQMGTSLSWLIYTGYGPTNKNTLLEKHEEGILVKAGIFLLYEKQRYELPAYIAFAIFSGAGPAGERFRIHELNESTNRKY